MTDQNLTERGKEFFVACDQLYSETELIPTGRAISERMLALGFKKPLNPNQIYQYRNRWITVRDLKQAGKVNHKSYPDPLLEAVDALRKQVRLETDQELARLRSEHETQQQLLKQQIDDLQTTLLQREQQRQQLLQQYEALSATAHADSLELKNISRAHDLVITEFSHYKLAATQRQTDLTQQNQQLDKLLHQQQDESASLKQQFVTEQDKLLQQQAEQYQRHIADKQNQLDNLTQRCETVQSTLTQAQYKNIAVNEQLAGCQAELEKSILQCKQQEQLIDKLKDTIQQYEKNTVAKETKIELLNTERARTNIELTQLNKKLYQAIEQQNALKIKLAQLTIANQ